MRRRVLGVPINSLTMAETLDHIARTIAARQTGAHLGLNAANVVRANRDPEYAHDLEGADILTADGQAIVWAARILGTELPGRVTGIDLMHRLISEAPERDWRVFLLGAAPEVVKNVASRLAARGVTVVGMAHGYFPEERSREIARMVADHTPDLLFVGMPSPRKERFIIRYALPAGIRYSVGVGGTFDVIAGRKRRAPTWIQRAGLEWAVRLAQEPRRLARRYTVTNLAFLRLIIEELRRRGRGA